MSDSFRQVRVTFSIPGRDGPELSARCRVPVGGDEAGVRLAAVAARRSSSGWHFELRTQEEVEAESIARAWLRERFRSWATQG